MEFFIKFSFHKLLVFYNAKWFAEWGEYIRLWNTTEISLSTPMAMLCWTSRLLPISSCFTNAISGGSSWIICTWFSFSLQVIIYCFISFWFSAFLKIVPISHANLMFVFDLSLKLRVQLYSFVPTKNFIVTLQWNHVTKTRIKHCSILIVHCIKMCYLLIGMTTPRSSLHTFNGLHELKNDPMFIYFHTPAVPLVLPSYNLSYNRTVFGYISIFYFFKLNKKPL